MCRNAQDTTIYILRLPPRRRQLALGVGVSKDNLLRSGLSAPTMILARSTDAQGWPRGKGGGAEREDNSESKGEQTNEINATITMYVVCIIVRITHQNNLSPRKNKTKPKQQQQQTLLYWTMLRAYLKIICLHRRKKNAKKTQKKCVISRRSTCLKHATHPSQAPYRRNIPP